MKVGQLSLVLRSELTAWDLGVSFDSLALVGDLLHALEHFTGVPAAELTVARSGELLDSAIRIADANLQSGDIVVLGKPIPRASGVVAPTAPTVRPVAVKPVTTSPPGTARPTIALGGSAPSPSSTAGRPSIPTPSSSPSNDATSTRPKLPLTTPQGQAPTPNASTKAPVAAGRATGQRLANKPTELFRTLDFVSGPDSGRCLNVAGGAEVVVGTSASVVGGRGYLVVVDHGSIAPNHFTVRIGPDLTATVTPVGGPLTVNDEFVAQGDTKVVSPTDLIKAGHHGFAIRRYERRPTTRDRLMQVEFRPTPYRPTVVDDVKILPLRPIPKEPTKNRLQLIAMLLPALLGGTFLAFTMFESPLNQQRLVMSLGFMLMSPLMMLGNFFSDRRQGKRTFADEVENFKKELADRVSRITEAKNRERIARWESSPDLPTLTRRALYRTPELWQRHRNADDLLTVRLGEFDTKPRISCEVDDDGQPDLVKEARDAIEALLVMPDVPYEADLKSLGILSITGKPAACEPIAASLFTQLATLHSPEDVVLVVLAPSSGKSDDTSLDLVRAARFLPHSRSLSSPLSRRHVATTPEGANEILGLLIGVAYERSQRESRGSKGSWPWVVVFVDERVSPSPMLVAQLAEFCPSAGISIVLSTESVSDVTRQARMSISVEGAKGVAVPMDPTKEIANVRVTTVRPTSFWETIAALAPLRDATERKAMAAIPRTADLFQTLEVAADLRADILKRWSQDRGYTLSHPIGIGPQGPFSIDLVADGPHTLIGGTSGSGKSELLMAMIAALACNYSPRRVNFLFFDYKGGAGTQIFANLPHTVGSVTNLDGELALRALTSLRAEITHRMHLITEQFSCKDLKEMQEKHPLEAPPSLVLVFDEFATLVKEVPEFVNGVVDIAQRGRSLGIHLILATQRPSGAINENIQANTSIRVALRMVDAAESGAVLGVPDAAEIPTPLRGRAFLRLGPKQIIPFQAAFTGAAAVKSNTAPVVIRALADEDTITEVVEKPVGPTQGETIVREIEGLWRSLGWNPPRRPWMPELPSLVTHEELRAVDDSVLGSDEFSLGLVDDPERQSQPLAIWDVRLASGMRVFGGSGSGKTSTLRLIGQLASDISRANDWDLVVLDLGTRGLADLQRCPNLVASGNADDIESLTRAIRYVSAEVQRRRALIAAKGCDSYMDLRDGDENPRRLMVLIDDYQNLEELVSVGDYARSAAEIEMALLSTAMIDARPTGVHFVISARRRNDLRSNLHAALGGRVVLRSDDEMELLDHGLPAAKSAGSLPPGRAFWLDDRRVQISMMDSRQSSTDSRGKLSAFGRILSQTKSGASRRPSSAALPSVVGMNCQASGLKVTVGIRDVSMESQEVDLAKAPLVVVGPRESGKSNTLQWVASQFVGTKLRWIKEAADLAEVSEGAVLLIDDSERFDDYALDDQLRLLRFERNCPVVLALNPRNTISSLARDVVRDATFLVLQPDDRHSSNFIQNYFDRSPYLRPGLQFPAGRGVMSIGRGASVIQVPLVGHQFNG